MELEIHPIDFDSLAKDSVLDQSRIESIYNVRKVHAPEAFRLCQLRLREDIERNRSDLLCRIQGDGIRIMTDTEANEHTWTEYGRGVRKISRQARRRCSINHNALDDGERRVAELRDNHVTAQAIMNRRELARFQRDRLLAGPTPAPLLEGDESEASAAE